MSHTSDVLTPRTNLPDRHDPAINVYPGQRLNIYSHLIGLALSLAFSALVLARCARQVDAKTIGGVVVFCLASAALFVASTVCHGSRGEARHLWQRLDHAATFWLIAGSYTPFALTAPREDANLAFLAAMWVAALLATVWQFRVREVAVPPTLLYIAMGWLGTAAAAFVAVRLSMTSLIWLFVGASLYCAGTAFYRNAMGWKHAHGVWHVFVVAGAVSHYAAVYFLVAA